MSTLRYSQNDVLIERYRITGHLATGGMQEVYHCHDLVLDREVVLKTPKKGLSDKRFQRGARMGGTMTHPNVAATLDYWDSEDAGIMIEEFIPGQNLGAILESKFYFLDPHLAAHLIHHIAKGIQEAHRKNICHRDIKPSNIMVSDDSHFSTIKLTDFGIAKIAETHIQEEMEAFAKDNHTLTSASTLLGAVPYLAPECWISWSGAGKPMDVWALGCILYQLLWGRLPFGNGIPAIAKLMEVGRNKKVSLSPPSWFGKHPATSQLEEKLWALVLECLVAEEDKRASIDRVVEICQNLCYSCGARRIARITTYPGTYATGGKGEFGFMLDLQSVESLFFHKSDHFGPDGPSYGQIVSYQQYPGIPNPRCSPVLHIKSV